MQVKDGRSSLLADFRWLFNPNALSKQLTENLAVGGLPLLYEVMLFFLFNSSISGPDTSMSVPR
jgi:hypothetical protein